jgi:hypothetical protein
VGVKTRRQSPRVKERRHEESKSKKKKQPKDLQELLSAMGTGDRKEAILSMVKAMGIGFNDDDEEVPAPSDDDVFDDELVNEIGEAYIEDSTRDNYRSRSQIRLVLFLHGNQPLKNLVHSDIAEELDASNGSMKVKREIITNALNRASKDFHPIVLVKFQAGHFIKNLLSLSDTENEEYLRAYGTHRSAMTELFSSCAFFPSEHFKQALSRLFKGSKVSKRPLQRREGLLVSDSRKARIPCHSSSTEPSAFGCLKMVVRRASSLIVF